MCYTINNEGEHRATHSRREHAMTRREKRLVRKRNEFSYYVRDLVNVTSTEESAKVMVGCINKTVVRKVWAGGLSRFVKVGDVFYKLSKTSKNGVHTVVDEYVERVAW